MHISIKKIYYPFPSVLFSSDQYYQLKKACVPFVIFSMDYNRMWSIALHYGSHEYGSLQISHSEVESLIQIIKAVNNLLVKSDSKKVIVILLSIVSTHLE